MTEEITEQTVVDATDTAAKPAVEGTSAREPDELENLLNEFDQAAKPAVSQPEQKPTQDVSALAEKVKNLEGVVTQVSQLRYKQDMEKTVNDIRGNLDPEFFDNDFIESWLDAQARKDPRLAQAWLNRDANPRNFEKVKVELGKNLAKKFSKMPDREATDTREAVAAAVRGASTNRALEQKPPNFAEQTNGEFNETVRKQYGFNPGV